MTLVFGRDVRCPYCKAVHATNACSRLGQPVARATDPDTSWEAAASVTRLRESQSRVLKTLRHFGPMTDEQIWAELENWWPRSMSVSGARTRRSELVRRGLVVDSGERVVGSTGRRMIVWTVA